MNQTRKDVLNGWKEIATYLGRDPRTVERWEKQRSLPVRRLPGSGRATVYALVHELDQWMASSPVRDPAPSTGSTGTAGEEEAPERNALVAQAALPPAQEDVDRETNSQVERRRWPWLRWTTPLTFLLLLFWVGFGASGWRRRHPESPPSGVAAPTARPHNLVPSSPVFGVEELYLRGCYQNELRSPESLRRAQEAFTAAIAKDPKYAPAYAGLPRLIRWRWTPRPRRWRSIRSWPRRTRRSASSTSSGAGTGQRLMGNSGAPWSWTRTCPWRTTGTGQC